MTRISGITPSGHAQLGNYLGAIRHWAVDGVDGDLYFVSDLHAMTTAYHPQRLRSLARETLAILVAAGIAQDRVFVQSDLIREIGALTWVLECTCTYGEASRMTQFKEKSSSKGVHGVRVGLFTYPVLMAADILLQGASEVPVGADQAQHVELARALARRFNGTYGEVFVVPEAVTPPAAARVRDFAMPARKMSKSTRDSVGVVALLDSPDVTRRKIRRAVTDEDGVANLLEILAACTGKPVEELGTAYAGNEALKNAVTEAVIDELRPVREGALALLADTASLDQVQAAGAEMARRRGEHRLAAALRMAGAS
jgi:tryptophanyl-tRNA synthetase